MYCEICGRPFGVDHQCSAMAIARREAMFRREEADAEDAKVEEPSFNERLETGFTMLSLLGQS